MRHLQKLGRALMQAVAVLPVAALLMGIGYAFDPDGWGANSPIAAFFLGAGGAVLDNLGLIFALAVAYGMSRDKDGAAALSGMIGFLVVTALLNVDKVAQLRSVKAEDITKVEGFFKINNGNVLIGIIMGVIAAALYNKFSKKELPAALAFFSGRRLVPILTSLVSLVVAGVLYFVWPIFFSGLVAFGETVQKMGAVGAGIYAFFNRLLIPFGLHHALNAVFWFDVANINDLQNFWKSIESTIPGVTTGMYMAGFFPIMMFGLPGAALAMFQCAKPGQKKVAGSLLAAGAVASFLTGVTEPLEFSFMFLAPALYVIHAVLTGISVFIAATLQWIAGFGFSAGLIDLVLSSQMKLAHNWYFLILQGAVFFVIYYVIFRFVITKFNLKTPGREDDISEDEGVVLDANTNFAGMASTILEGLGGKENVEELDYCATRLRVGVNDYLLVDEKKIKQAGVAGVIRPSQKSVQVIVGPQVQFVHDEVKKQMQ